MCIRDRDEGGFGFCSKTLDPRFRKDGGKAWYAVLKTSEDGGEPYWGREYAVSYTHLDVYKRQMSDLPIAIL